MPECTACQNRGKTWQGGDPVCAFPNGVFDSSNWNMRVFHHTDNDGKCAAAIVLLAYPSQDIQLTPVDYKDPFPFDGIKPNEEVWIVDFHLATKENWERLLAITPNVKWFDHHVMAVEKFQEYKDRIPGTRAVGKAGCMLVWEYLFPRRRFR